MSRGLSRTFCPKIHRKSTEHRDALRRTGSRALAAADTFLRIDGREEIFHMDGVVGADLGAFHAADTPRLTGLADRRAFLMAGTAHHAFCGSRDQRDQMLGAGFDTQAAGLSLIHI